MPKGFIRRTYPIDDTSDGVLSNRIEGKGSAMKKGLTEIVLVIDRSGSMSGLESDTIGGVNALIRKNQELEGEAVLTTVLFNHGAKTLHDRVDIRDVKPLGERDYEASGTTALLDAVGDAVSHIDRVQGCLPEDFRPEHTVVAITTDGLENSSRRYTYDEVKRLIERQTEKGWEFLFLGANIDVAAEAGRMGIRGDRAASFVCDAEGSAVAYDAFSRAVCSLRSCELLPDDWRADVDADYKSRG